METKEEPKPKSYVQLIFPAGPGTTAMQLTIYGLDTAQIEMAGRALIRLAESQYNDINQRHGGIVLPTPGSPGTIPQV